MDLRERARERLESLADAPLGADEACLAAIEILRPAVGFERWCWPRTDPGSAVATSGLARFDLWREVPRIAALEEHGDVTSKPHLVTGPTASVSLHVATHGDLARSIRWSECLRPYGVGDELMTVCRDPHGCWGSVELMRDSDDPPFDADDVAFLDSVAPVIARLLRRSQHHVAAATPPTLPPATLILAETLEPASWTPSFRAWLGELSPDGVGLPPAVFELCARVRTPPSESAGLPAAVRLRTAAGRWATLEAARLEGASPDDVAVTFRESSQGEVFDLLCLTYELTRRERQLVALVLDGLATKQLAQAMCISPWTVQDHLKGVFAKTGLRSRRELSSRFAGRAA